MKSFNVIICSFNDKTFESYDIMPTLLDDYKSSKQKPVTKEQFREFVRSKSMYHWWGRCEYEVILQSWPTGRAEEKIDIHWQVMMNIDLITSLLMDNVTDSGKGL